MKLKHFKLSDGDKGIDQTAAVMRRLARTDVNEPNMQQVVRSFRPGPLGVRDAFNYVVSLIPYVNDPGRTIWVEGIPYTLPKDEEFLVAPRHFINRKITGGDCDDMSTTLASLLLALGFEVRYKVIAWRREEFTHVYLLCTVPGFGIIPLDPVKGYTGFGWEKPGIIRTNTYKV